MITVNARPIPKSNEEKTGKAKEVEQTDDVAPAKKKKKKRRS